MHFTSSQIHVLRVESKEEKAEKELSANNDKAYSLEEVRINHKGVYRPWTKELDEELIIMYCEGINVRDISKHFERAKGAIRTRIKKIELAEIYG